MKEIKIVNNIHIAAGVIWNFVVQSFKNPRRLRFDVIRPFWCLMKLHAATGVRNIGVAQIKGLGDVNVNLTVNSYDRAVLCAITRLVQPKNFFEIGTYIGETTLAVAHNNPDAKVYTLDLPDADSRGTAALEMTDEYLFERWDRGSSFKGKPEEARIEMLSGDSATFDFTPYLGKMDAIFIDASHSYSYVKADTEAALKILSPTGTILWHDYPAYPGIFAYLNELAAEMNGKIFHILGTGLAFFSRQDLVDCPPLSK